ncbi:hypothetical protein CSW27_03805, partial [Thermus scotoductus]
EVSPRVKAETRDTGRKECRPGAGVGEEPLPEGLSRPAPNPGGIEGNKRGNSDRVVLPEDAPQPA